MKTQPGDTSDHYQAALNEAAIFDMSSYGLLDVSGPDARQFLHNLCTNDVKNLAEGAGCEAFFTTAKARVVAHVFISHLRQDDQPVFRLDMVPGLAEKLSAHLNRHIISEQVEVADRSGDLAMLRLCGPRAAKLVQDLFGSDLGDLEPLHIRSVPGSTWVRRFSALGPNWFDVVCPAPALSSLRDQLVAGGAAVAVPDAYEVLRVEAGLPVFGKDIDENRLVMEVGRTVQAINYAKGCFLGQEPIVMARDRGQVNRTLLGVTVAEGEPLAPGTRLFRGEVEAGQATSSVRSPRLGQVIALAYLKRGHQEPGLELLVEPATEGRKAVVASLPFV